MKKLPKQTPPIDRSSLKNVPTISPGQHQVQPQGCCVRVLGQCILESPIC